MRAAWIVDTLHCIYCKIPFNFRLITNVQIQAANWPLLFWPPQEPQKVCMFFGNFNWNIDCTSAMIATRFCLNRAKTPTNELVRFGPCRSWLFSETLTLDFKFCTTVKASFVWIIYSMVREIPNICSNWWSGLFWPPFWKADSLFNRKVIWHSYTGCPERQPNFVLAFLKLHCNTIYMNFLSLIDISSLSLETFSLKSWSNQQFFQFVSTTTRNPQRGEVNKTMTKWL